MTKRKNKAQIQAELDDTNQAYGDLFTAFAQLGDELAKAKDDCKHNKTVADGLDKMVDGLKSSYCYRVKTFLLTGKWK